MDSIVIGEVKKTAWEKVENDNEGDSGSNCHGQGPKTMVESGHKEYKT